MGYLYTEKLFIVYLKFKVTWTSCIFSFKFDNPSFKVCIITLKVLSQVKVA